MSNISLLSTHCADSDIEGTYPAIQRAINGNKETTKLELCEIEGASYIEHRIGGLNNVAGIVNTLENIVMFCKAPTLDEMLNHYRQTKGY